MNPNPGRIHLGHIKRFRGYGFKGQSDHLIFRHRLSWNRIARWAEDVRSAIHESLHFHLGMEAHR